MIKQHLIKSVNGFISRVLRKYSVLIRRYLPLNGPEATPPSKFQLDAGYL